MYAYNGDSLSLATQNDRVYVFYGKHQDLSSDPQPLGKKTDMAVSIYYSTAEGRETGKFPESVGQPAQVK